MVFVKFPNMNRKKKNFLMSPLNSNKLKKFHFTTSQNNVTITVQKCSVFFSSFFFNLCSDVLSILLKCLFFLSFFFFYMLCSTMFKFLFLLFFFFFFCFSPFSLSCSFLFLFWSSFLFSFFFHNKLLIQCPFFFSTSYLPLCLYLNTITIGSLPSLFNFGL